MAGEECSAWDYRQAFGPEMSISSCFGVRSLEPPLSFPPLLSRSLSIFSCVRGSSATRVLHHTLLSCEWGSNRNRNRLGSHIHPYGEAVGRCVRYIVLKRAWRTTNKHKQKSAKWPGCSGYISAWLYFQFGVFQRWLLFCLHRFQQYFQSCIQLFFRIWPPLVFSFVVPPAIFLFLPPVAFRSSCIQLYFVFGHLAVISFCCLWVYLILWPLYFQFLGSICMFGLLHSEVFSRLASGSILSLLLICCCCFCSLLVFLFVCLWLREMSF